VLESIGTVAVEAGERELVLDGAVQFDASVGEASHHAGEELARTGLVRHPIQTHVVDDHRRRPRGVWEHRERRRVGHEADLADRSHSVDRLELVERVHRLHGDGQSDPAGHPRREVLDRHDLAAHESAVVAVEEPHQADACLLARRHQLVNCRHGRHTVLPVR
jgi:hypothetical protein